MRRIAGLLLLVFVAIASGATYFGPGGILTYDVGTAPSGTPVTTMRTNRWYINNSRIPRGSAGIGYDASAPNSFAFVTQGNLTPVTTSGTLRPAYCNQPWVGAAGVNRATFTGSISGTTLTVTAMSSGTIVPGNPGQVIDPLQLGAGDSGVGVKILSQLTGTTGGVGTYQLGGSFTVGSIPWTSQTNACQRNAGNFRTVVGFVKMDYADPIVLPNQPGKSHLHVFFGNTGVNAYSTNDGGPRSITNHGNSAASGGTLNRSAYWIPAMIYHCPIGGLPAGCDPLKDGLPIVPTLFQIYYKGSHGQGAFLNDGSDDTPWTSTHDVASFPQGFRMLGGNPASSAPQTSPTNIVTFNCTLANDQVVHLGPNIPGTGVGATDACTVAEATAQGSTQRYMRHVVEFPSCWIDTHDLDSPTHNSHVAYYSGGNGTPCPGGFSTQVIGIHYQIDYYFSGTGAMPDAMGLADMKYWRLASDNYPDTNPAGYSGHGDWFNGWQQAIMDRWVQDCVQRGTDCHDNIAGTDPTNSTNPYTIFRAMEAPRRDR